MRVEKQHEPACLALRPVDRCRQACGDRELPSLHSSARPAFLAVGLCLIGVPIGGLRSYRIHTWLEARKLPAGVVELDVHDLREVPKAVALRVVRVDGRLAWVGLHAVDRASASFQKCFRASIEVLRQEHGDAGRDWDGAGQIVGELVMLLSPTHLSREEVCHDYRRLRKGTIA